jgi:hypothetical protein
MLLSQMSFLKNGMERGAVGPTIKVSAFLPGQGPATWSLSTWTPILEEPPPSGGVPLLVELNLTPLVKGLEEAGFNTFFVFQSPSEPTEPR